MSAARRTLNASFGESTGELLLEAARYGADVARTLKAFHEAERFVLSPQTRAAIERAMLTWTDEKGENQRRIKAKRAFIMAGLPFSKPIRLDPELLHNPSSHSRTGSGEGREVPHRTYLVFADILDHLQGLHDAVSQIERHGRTHPDFRNAIRELANPKKVMTAYVLRVAHGLAVRHLFTTTDMVALAVAVGIEKPSLDTRKLKDNWRNVIEAAPEAEAALAQLPPMPARVPASLLRQMAAEVLKAAPHYSRVVAGMKDPSAGAILRLVERTSVTMSTGTAVRVTPPREARKRRDVKKRR